MRRLLLTCLLMLTAVLCAAQEIKVTSFRLDPRDLEAKLNPVYDSEGVAAALVRVQTTRDHLRIEGETVREPSFAGGEWLVYLRPSATALTIRAKGIGACTYEFGTPLSSSYVYEMRLDIPEPERGDVLVMPQVALHASQTSYGMMLGYVRRWGGYVSVRSDFHKLPAPAGECDSDGYYSDGTPGWFSGQSLKSRWSATAGVMRRITGPLCAYAGAGYGQRSLLWGKHNSTDYVRVSSASVRGFELECGLVMDIADHLAVSAGVCQTSFRWVEASLGVGLTF